MPVTETRLVSAVNCTRTVATFWAFFSARRKLGLPSECPAVRRVAEAETLLVGSTGSVGSVEPPVTVTVQEALLPFAVRAVMTAVPALRAVTVPFVMTVATTSLFEDQVTDLSVAVAGSTVAESLTVLPASSVSAVLLKVTDEASVLPVSSLVSMSATGPSAESVAVKQSSAKSV